MPPGSYTFDTVTLAHVFVVVVHDPHTEVEAPVGQLLVRVCVIVPVCPAGHASVCVCGDDASIVQLEVTTLATLFVLPPAELPLEEPEPEMDDVAAPFTAAESIAAILACNTFT
jgi:hypothetical protein